MIAVLSWFRAELRRRWRAWVGMALLLGLFGGVVSATVAGARRTETSYARLERSNRTADLRVSGFVPNPQIAVVSPEEIEELAETGGNAAEANSFRVYSSSDQSFPAALNASADGRAFGTGLARLKVLRGRLADPRRADEAVVDFTLVKPLHLRLGQRLDLRLVPSLGGDTHRRDEKGSPLNASVKLVGVVAAPTQFPPFDPDNYYPGGAVYLTPAFHREVDDRAVALDLTLLKARPGRLAALEGDVQALGRGKPVSNIDLLLQGREVERSIRLEGIALRILASLLGVVLVLIAAQLLSRQAFLDGTDNRVLIALGMSRVQLVGFAVVRALAIAVVAAVTAMVTTIAASPFLSIGLARIAEPHPGVSFDAVAAGLGALVILVVVIVGSAWPAWRAANAAVLGVASEDGYRSRSSALAGALSRAGLPPAATSGVRMALEGGRGSSAVPVRSTVAAAVVGITAVVGSLTFGASLTHLLRTPTLYGVSWDAEILNADGPNAVRAAEAILQRDDDIGDAAYIQTGMGFRLNGIDLTGFSFRNIKGSFPLSTLSGHQPAKADEIMLGTKSMEALNTRVGATLEGIAENEDATPVPVRVVGRGVLPPGNATGRLGQGVIVTRAGIERLAEGRVRSAYTIAVRFRPGVDEAEAGRSLLARLRASDPQFSLQNAPEPNDLVNFGRIENLPLIFGLVLAGLAALTLVHLLATSFRRRRHDLAILKTLGFVRRQVASTMVWQATTLAGIALLVAVPLGLAAGRGSWLLFADTLGILPRLVTPPRSVAAVVLVTFVLAVLMAVVPAAIASRLRPAAILRSE